MNRIMRKRQAPDRSTEYLNFDLSTFIFNLRQFRYIRYTPIFAG